MKKQSWYFIVTFTDGLKNSEWKLSKTAAKALYDYHIKNMVVLDVQKASFGSYDEA
jgi:hypothetical protein